MKTPCRFRSGTSSRRGMGVAAVVVVLAMLNLVVVGSVAASADEAGVGSLRLQSVQAFYAAEAGGMIIAKVSSALSDNPGLGIGPEPRLRLPAQGSSLALRNSAQIDFTQLPAALADGVAVVHGRSGTCARRVQITMGPE